MRRRSFANHRIAAIANSPSESPYKREFVTTTLLPSHVMVVRSLISHLAEKEENRCIHTPIEESADLLMDWKYTPREAELAAAADVARVLRDFAGDKLMTDYIRLRITEQCRDAAEYARALGVTVAAIHNMNRRLARYRDRQRRETRPTNELPN